MPIVATEEEPAFHLPEGLWPVYVALLLGVGCVVAIGVLYAYFIPVLRSYPRAPRRLAALAGVWFVAAAALYAYADSRYEDCLADGDHLWSDYEVAPGSAVCDRAVVGDVVVYRRPP